MKKTLILAATSLAAFGLPVPASAQHGHFIVAQSGYGVTAFGVGARIGPERTLWTGESWRVDHDWKFRIARWGSHRAESRAKSLWDFGAYQSLRILPLATGTFVPFAEGALGMHVLTHARIGDRAISTAFQFGQHLAVGARFGERHAYSLAVRAEHVSNANIKRPNDGVSFFGFEFQYDWR